MSKIAQGPQNVRKWISQFDYKPLSAMPVVAMTDVLSGMSPQSRITLDLLEEEATGHVLDARVWSSRGIAVLRRQSEDVRREVLAGRSVSIHELTHQLDTYASPFGAAYAARAALECIGLLRDCPWLVERLREEDPFEPIIKGLPVGDQTATRFGLSALRTTSLWLSAVQGNASVSYRPVSGPLPNVFSLLGQQFAPVMVNEAMVTIATGPGEYLRPIALLEARAIAMSGLHLLGRLGNDEDAVRDVMDLLTWSYSPESAFLNYTFLFRLVEKITGVDLSQAKGTDGVTAEQLRTALQLVSGLSWYALNGPTFQMSRGELGPDATLRLIVIARQLEQEIVGTSSPEIDLGHLFEAADRSLAQAGFRSDPEVALSAAIAYVRSAQHRVRGELAGPVSDHFHRLLDFHARALEVRRGHGYMIQQAVPLDGGLGGFATSLGPSLQTDLFTDYELDPSVSSYLRVRENLMTRRARPPGIWDDYWDAVLAREQGAEPQGHDAGRRQEAIDRSWAVTQVLARAAGPLRGTTVQGHVHAVAIPRAWLPQLFDAGNEVRTQWFNLVRGDMTLIGIELTPPEGNPISIVYESVGDAAALSAVRAGAAIVLVCDEDLRENNVTSASLIELSVPPPPD